jgi:hypothetical protein
MISEDLAKASESPEFRPIILRVPPAGSSKRHVAKWLPVLLAPFVGLLLLAMSIVKLWWGHVMFESCVLLFFAWLVCTTEGVSANTPLTTAIITGTLVQLKLLSTAVLGPYPG